MLMAVFEEDYPIALPSLHHGTCLWHNPLKKTSGWKNPVKNPGPSAEIYCEGPGAVVNLWEGKKENTNPNQLAGPPPCNTCSFVKCTLSTCSGLDSPRGLRTQPHRTDESPARGQPAARLLGSHAWVCMESPGEAVEKSAGLLSQRFRFSRSEAGPENCIPGQLPAEAALPGPGPPFEPPWTPASAQKMLTGRGEVSGAGGGPGREPKGTSEKTR